MRSSEFDLRAKHEVRSIRELLGTSGISSARTRAYETAVMRIMHASRRVTFEPFTALCAPPT